jgi:hypothetical protein
MADDDTVERPALRGSDPETFVKLRRIAIDLDLIAEVLGGYPHRNPDVWLSAEWEKPLKDLELACERLRARAQQLDQIADELKG